MVRDWKNRDVADYVPKHAVQMISESSGSTSITQRSTSSIRPCRARKLSRKCAPVGAPSTASDAIIKRTQIGPLRKTFTHRKIRLCSDLPGVLHALSGWDCRRQRAKNETEPDGQAASPRLDCGDAPDGRLVWNSCSAIVAVKPKPEVFAAEPRSSTFGAGVP